ncbi:Cation Diffusion Facilitator (CDF) Family [Phytophthora cinnamomi]|uniref:Cation Diffusion Facilitator (CDF) Family n=1 Tax=Phytophthora cinnamomi TaxID=4785 RepID=UPI0035594C77|nr:Cation Diffusion Facilitator (CDF) Family [Phytophthora cinnamomi]
MLLGTGSDKCSPGDDALIDSPRRIPLTESARRAQRKLQLACLCSVLFMCAEVVGGSFAGSLAIMTDAAHLLSDVAGFCISLFAIWMGTLPASNHLSFGFQRAEVIGAVISVLLIWVLTGVLLYAAVNRFIECLKPHPKEHVDGKLMFIVACIATDTLMEATATPTVTAVTGIRAVATVTRTVGEEGTVIRTVKTITTDIHTELMRFMITRITLMDMKKTMTSTEGLVQENQDSHSHEEEDLDHGHYHAHDEHNNVTDQDIEAVSSSKPKTKKNLENLNIESAYIHALGDFIQSLGVCIAGGLIWLKPEWQIADPIATFIFSVLVLLTTVGIIRESVHILMEGTPRGIDVQEIEQGLRQCSSVVAVHDLHIWSLSAGLPSLSVHLVSNDVETALHSAQSYLLSKGITHTTIQTERTSTSYPRDCQSDLKCGQVSPAHGV